MEASLKVCGDHEIVRRVIAGDVNAFEELVRRHEGKVFGVVAKRVERNDVEAVAQEVFVDAYRSLRSYSMEKPFEHWLLRIAMRRCCDYWRSRERRVETPASSFCADWQDFAEHLCAIESKEEFEREAARREMREILEWAMARLDADDRALIDLLYFEGWSVDETASLMGWGTSRVKVRALRARRRLRAMLESGIVEV